METPLEHDHQLARETIIATNIADAVERGWMTAEEGEDCIADYHRLYQMYVYPVDEGEV